MGKKKRPRGRPDSIEVFDTDGLIRARRYAHQGLKINEIAEKFGMSKASLMRAQARTDDPRGPKLKRFLDMGRYHKVDPLAHSFLWVYDKLNRLDDEARDQYGEMIERYEIPIIYQTLILDHYYPDRHDEALSHLSNLPCLIMSMPHESQLTFDELFYQLDENSRKGFSNLMGHAHQVERLLKEIENLNYKAANAESIYDHSADWRIKYLKKYAYRGFERPITPIDSMTKEERRRIKAWSPKKK